MRKEIAIRNYSSNDYNEILSLGYAFSPSYLKPSLFIKFLKHLGWTDLFTLVAYHRVKRKIAGVVTCMKYTKKIWIIGPLFVFPDFRCMGVGSMLVTIANQIMKDKGVKKTFLDVAKGNPAMKLYRKLGMEMLAPILRVCGTLNSLLELEEPKQRIDINEAKVHDIPQLFKIYQQNTTSPWINFFEINKDNFLIEYSQSIRVIPNIFKRRKVITAEINGRVFGYCIIILPKHTFFGKIKFSEIDIFISQDVPREDLAKALIKRAIKELRKHKIAKTYLFFISNNDNFAWIEGLLDHLKINKWVHYCMGCFL